MENAEKAIMMAFAVFVLVIALSIAIYLFSKVTVTSEQLAFYSDSTIYYDNVEIDESKFAADAEEDIKNGTVRIVSAETIIPTLYRYYKENFCVKIYGEKINPSNPNSERHLIQIFDVNLEGKVHGAAGDTHATDSATAPVHIENYAYNKAFNDDTKKYCLFGAPWLGSTEAVKTRVDLFVEGKPGYINNTFVDYRENRFYKARDAKEQFKERFISYSYTGQTMMTEDGEELVTGEKSKDKIVIIYTLID